MKNDAATKVYDYVYIWCVTNTTARERDMHIHERESYAYSCLHLSSHVMWVFLCFHLSCTVLQLSLYNTRILPLIVWKAGFTETLYNTKSWFLICAIKNLNYAIKTFLLCVILYDFTNRNIRKCQNISHFFPVTWIMCQIVFFAMRALWFSVFLEGFHW